MDKTKKDNDTSSDSATRLRFFGFSIVQLFECLSSVIIYGVMRSAEDERSYANLYHSLLIEYTNTSTCIADRIINVKRAVANFVSKIITTNFNSNENAKWIKTEQFLKDIKNDIVNDRNSNIFSRNIKKIFNIRRRTMNDTTFEETLNNIAKDLIILKKNKIECTSVMAILDYDLYKMAKKREEKEKTLLEYRNKIHGNVKSKSGLQNVKIDEKVVEEEEEENANDSYFGNIFNLDYPSWFIRKYEKDINKIKLEENIWNKEKSLDENRKEIFKYALKTKSENYRKNCIAKLTEYREILKATLENEKNELKEKAETEKNKLKEKLEREKNELKEKSEMEKNELRYQKEKEKRKKETLEKIDELKKKTDKKFRKIVAKIEKKKSNCYDNKLKEDYENTINVLKQKHEKSKTDMEILLKKILNERE